MITFDESTIKENEKTMTAEMLVDTEHVCVPLNRYEQLITTETMLAIIQKSVRTMASYQVTDILKLLFPEDVAKGDPDA